MKIRLHHTLFVAALFMAPVYLHAQDNGFNEIDAPNSNASYERGENDPTLNSGGEGEVRQTKTHSVVRDSATTSRPVNTIRKPQHDSKEVKPQGGEDESILSYNFLYYIIQKFKFQDIMD